MTKEEILVAAYKTIPPFYDEEIIKIGWIRPRKVYQLSRIIEGERKIYHVTIATLKRTGKCTRHYQLFTYRGLADMFVNKVAEREAIIQFLKLNKKGKML